MITGLLAVSFMIGAVAAGQDAAFVHRLDYDRNAPLDIKEAAVEQRDDIAIHDISYASPKGGRVPAYLVVPSGKGPFAAVIWGHWYWENSEFRNRKEFLSGSGRAGARRRRFSAHRWSNCAPGAHRRQSAAEPAAGHRPDSADCGYAARSRSAARTQRCRSKAAGICWS